MMPLVQVVVVDDLGSLDSFAFLAFLRQWKMISTSSGIGVVVHGKMLFRRAFTFPNIRDNC
jgi:hypothetical protein